MSQGSWNQFLTVAEKTKVSKKDANVLNGMGISAHLSMCLFNVCNAQTLSSLQSLVQCVQIVYTGICLLLITCFMFTLGTQCLDAKTGPLRQFVGVLSNSRRENKGLKREIYVKIQ